METPTGTRYWGDKEIRLLLDLVEKNYSLLIGSAHVGRKRGLVQAKWESITEKVNALSGGSHTFALRQVKKKWFDMKCSAKREVNKWKLACKIACDEGDNTEDIGKPSDVDLRIYNMPNKDANNMDSAPTSETDSVDYDSVTGGEDYGQIAILNGVEPGKRKANCPEEKLNVNIEIEEPRAPKRPKFEAEYMDMRGGSSGDSSSTKAQGQDFSSGFEDICWQIAKSNYILETMSNEMKRSNDLNEKLVTSVCRYLNGLSRSLK